MAQNHQTPCIDCTKPAFGERCRTCSNKFNMRRPAKPSAEQQPRVGCHMDVRKSLLPARSWWAEDQQYFYLIAYGEYVWRMSKNTSVAYQSRMTAWGVSDG